MPFLRYLLVFGLLVCCVFGNEHPSIRVRVTRKGLDYVNKLAAKYLENALVARDIPIFKSGIGENNEEAKLTLENIRIASFAVPNIGYKLVPPSELLWYAEGGNMTVEGTFKIEVNKFIRVKGSGSLSANISGIEFSAGAEILSGNMEEPVINITTCTANIENMEIRYSGGLIAWLLNKFRETIDNKVTELLTQTIVDRVSVVGEHFANSRLGALPMMIELPANMFLNYRMARAVQVTDEYIDFLHRGEVTVGGMRAIDYPPVPLPESNRSDHMVLVWVSQYMVNSLMASVQQQGLLQLQIDEHRYPHMAKTLRTTCGYSEECIGVAIGKIGAIAPNTTAIIKLVSPKPPKFTVIKGYSGPKANGTLDGTLYVKNGTEEQPLFTFEIVYDLASTIKVDRGRIFAEVRIIRITVDVVGSEIGRISAMDMIFIEMAVQDELQKSIDEMLKGGLEIPALSVMKYRFPEVVLDHQSILAYSDMFFTPV